MVSVLPKAGFFLLFNLIPHSPDGFYKARLSGRLAELFTESADVSHDRIVVIEKLFAPDGLEELFRGDDPALVLAEIPEYRKLDGRELHGLAIERALVRLPVYDKAANIALLLKAVLAAEGKVGLLLNAKKADLDKILGKLPALERPTISPLSDSEWVALNTIVSEHVVRELIPDLKHLGASGIVEYPLNKIVE